MKAHCMVLLVASMMLINSVWGQEHWAPDFTPILIPVAFTPYEEMRGSNGTIWRGAVWLHVTGRDFGNIDLNPLGGCGVPCPGRYETRYTGRVTGDPLERSFGRGVVMVVRKSDAEIIHLSARMFEVTRKAQPQGVDVPVVREEEFLTKPTTLLGVSSTPAVRSALRIYEPRRHPSARFRVDILGQQSAVLASREIQTEVSSGPRLAERRSPGYAAIHNLAQEFPIVQTLDEFHVRITPLTEGLEYWSMVSVTDNDTQHVLLITPQ